MQNQLVKNDDIILEWDEIPLVPDAEYQAVYVKHETYNGSFGPKIKITFRITSFGKYYGSEICAWYNAKGLKAKPGKNRAVIISRHSKLTGELLRVLGIKERISRLSPSQLAGRVLLLKTRTVTTNSRQKKLTDLQKYSVVDTLICALTHTDLSQNMELKKTLKVLPKPIPEPIPTSKSPDPSPA